MSNRNNDFMPEHFGLFEQLFATIVIVGYHVLRSIASLGRK